MIETILEAQHFTGGDDGPTWNQIAPIVESDRFRVMPIPANSKGREGGTFRVTREQAEEALRNFAALQSSRIPILLNHPYKRDRDAKSAGAAGLPSEEFRKVGNVIGLRISEDGQWLESLDEFTDEGRGLVRSGAWDQMSPTIFFNVQDQDGKPAGAMLFEKSLVPVGEFREQRQLAAAITTSPGFGDMNPASGEELEPMTEFAPIVQALGVETADEALAAIELLKSQATAPEAPDFSARVETLEATVTELRATNATLTAEQGKRRADDLIAWARGADVTGFEKPDGARITHEAEVKFLELAVDDFDRARGILEAMPVIKTFGEKGSSTSPTSAPEVHTQDTAGTKLTDRAGELVAEARGAMSYRDALTQAQRENPALALTAIGAEE